MSILRFAHKTTRPSKEAIRSYFMNRIYEKDEPPPTSQEIREQLHWHLLPLTQQPDHRLDSSEPE